MDPECSVKGENLKHVSSPVLKKKTKHPPTPTADAQGKVCVSLESPVLQDIPCVALSVAWTSEVLGPVEHPLPEASRLLAKEESPFSQAEDSPSRGPLLTPWPWSRIFQRVLPACPESGLHPGPSPASEQALGSVLQRCHPLNAPHSQPHPGLCCPACVPCPCSTSWEQLGVDSGA